MKRFIPPILKIVRQTFYVTSVLMFLLTARVSAQVSNNGSNATPDQIDILSMLGNFPEFVPGDKPLQPSGGATGGCAPGAAASGGGATAANIDTDKGFSLGTSPEERQVNLAKALMRDYGLSQAQAAGAVGNFMRESGTGLPPNINQGGSLGPPNGSALGYGWAQWSGGRKTSFVNFYKQNGYAATDGSATDAADYAYLKNELNGSYQTTISELKNQTTPEGAAQSFEATFEGAGVKAQAQRDQYAQQVFSNLQKDTTGGLAAGAGGSTTAAGGDTVTGSQVGSGAGDVASCGAAGAVGGVTSIGEESFPLQITKSGIRNPEMFNNGTANPSNSHPYNAFDIYADPGTPVVALLDGVVVDADGRDKCGGRYVEIRNDAKNLNVAYMHMNTAEASLVTKGQQVTHGQVIGHVGSVQNGCTVAHLHIDESQGASRPGCTRENCPPANKAQFVDFGPDLYKLWQALPE